MRRSLRPSRRMNMLLLSSFVTLVTVSDGAHGQSKQPLDVVETVDLGRYAGRWYEIARLPNWFQKQCAGEVTASYTVLNDRSIEVINRCRKENGQVAKAVGRAKRASKDGPNTKLRVRFAPAFLSFLPFVWGDYWIVDLASDYSYAVVGEPSRKYLWVLSRTPEMDETTLQSILDRVKERGYDLTGLIRTRQTRE
jgi:apolipoprotein D and lipocalin family protein